MPPQIVDSLLLALQERSIGHGEETGPRALAEHGGQLEQLALPADLPGQGRATWARISHDLIGRESEGAQVGALAQQLAHLPDFVVGRLPCVDIGHTHDGGTDRHMADQEGVIEQDVESVQSRRVRRQVGPIERDAGLEGHLGNLLDGAHGGDEVPAGSFVEHGRQGVAAIGGHHGGHPETGGRGQIRIPEEVRVEMRVRIDEPRSQDEVATADLLDGVSGHPTTDLGDPSVADGDISLGPGTPCAVDHGDVAKDQFMFGVGCHRSSDRDARAPVGAGALGYAKRARPRISTLARVGTPAGQVGSVNALCGTRTDRLRSVSCALNTSTSCGVMSR